MISGVIITYLRRCTNILVDLENQFKLNPFDEISYTINPEKLINGTKLSEQKVCSAVKGFLHAEQKPYSTRMSGHGRRRYTVTINKEEFNIWKEDVEKLAKRG